MAISDKKIEQILQSHSEVNLRLDGNYTDRIRLVLQDVSTYECCLQKWGVVLQYFQQDFEPTTNIASYWCDYYTLARFEMKDGAVAYGSMLTLNEIMMFLEHLEEK